MADILLYGATGYTGRLTARALARREASFAIAGRNPAKLEALAAVCGSPDIHVIPEAGVDDLVAALADKRTLITCVGPFADHGETAVEAAVRARVNYVDSTGEGTFVARLVAERHEQCSRLGITMAPALGFDEVPADVACTLAAEGMDAADLWVTYALPRSGSTGTVRSSLQIVASRAPWVEDGEQRMVAAGEETRWAPMPYPLGPRKTHSFPFALCHLAPMHLDLRNFRSYVTTGRVEGALMRGGAPLLRSLLATPAKEGLEWLIDRGKEGPDDLEREQGLWTILAEARAGGEWRNITLTGNDVYGLTAETLARAAIEMSSDGYERSGVLSPVQAVGLEVLVEELETWGVKIDTYAPA